MKVRIRKYLFLLFHWEFWPNIITYSIPGLYLLFLAIKSKSFGFFSAANPSIMYGGLVNTSKFNIYQLIPEKYYPKTVLFKPNTSISHVLESLSNHALSFPLISKPDIGFQGIGVEILYSTSDLAKYCETTMCDFIIQPFIEYPNEVGIFYCRMPENTKGDITGIVGKEYPFIKGDGISTLQELIEKDKRLFHQKSLFKNILKTSEDQILRKGELFYLSKIGNHARGTKFIDMSYLINDKLLTQIDAICKEIPLFYYGRIDIKFANLNDLENGFNFYIIEVNGAMSLPTHMYDPNHSLFYAWKEMIKHFNYLYTISAQNHKKGYDFTSFEDFITMLKIYFQNSQKLFSKN